MALGKDKDVFQAELTAQILRLQEQEAQIEQLNATRGVMEQTQHEDTHKQQVQALRTDGSHSGVQQLRGIAEVAALRKPAASECRLSKS